MGRPETGLQDSDPQNVLEVDPCRAGLNFCLSKIVDRNRPLYFGGGWILPDLAEHRPTLVEFGPTPHACRTLLSLTRWSHHFAALPAAPRALLPFVVIDCLPVPRHHDVVPARRSPALVRVAPGLAVERFPDERASMLSRSRGRQIVPCSPPPKVASATVGEPSDYSNH